MKEDTILVFYCCLDRLPYTQHFVLKQNKFFISLQLLQIRRLGYLNWFSAQGLTKLKSNCQQGFVHYWSPRKESAPKLIQLIGQIQFLLGIELFLSVFQSGGQSLLLDADFIPSHAFLGVALQQCQVKSLLNLESL